MNDERPIQPNDADRGKPNAGAIMGPDPFSMIAAPSRGYGTPQDSPSESEVERKGGPRRLRPQGFLDRLLNRHPDEPAP